MKVDGNDPLLVHEAMKIAVDRARRGEGATLLECKTVRWERHSAISAGKYEDEEEAMKWKKADPIPRFEKRLVGEFGVDPAQLRELEAHAQQEADDALAFAKASPVPDPKTVGDFLYA